MKQLATVLVLLAVSGCNGLKQNTEDCWSNEDCLSGCCYPSSTRQPWCTAGTMCLPEGLELPGRPTGGGAGGGSSSGGGGGSASTGGGGGTTATKGACAYYDSSLNRILCEQNTIASSCSGKFQAGGSCSTLSCPQGTGNPQNCSFSGGGTGGGTGSGGGSGGGGGSSLACGRYTIIDPGSDSTPGSGYVHDARTGYTWTRHNAEGMSQADASSYCAGRGMRLPTRAQAQEIAAACCVTTTNSNGGTTQNCNAGFPVWQSWTTTSAGSGNAYYVNSHNITCLPSNCIRPVTNDVGVMCFRQ